MPSITAPSIVSKLNLERIVGQLVRRRLRLSPLDWLGKRSTPGRSFDPKRGGCARRHNQARRAILDYIEVDVHSRPRGAYRRIRMLMEHALSRVVATSGHMQNDRAADTVFA